MRGLRRTRPTSVLTLHACAAGESYAKGYPRRSPVLTVRLGTSVVMVGTRYEDRVGVDDITVARELASAATEFADLCERMYRGLPNSSGRSAGEGNAA